MPGRRPTVYEGIARATRRAASGGRPETIPQQQLTGLYIGIVMDDFDEQRLGQIWVYIPGISARRFSRSQAVPSYGGTVPDRDNDEAQLRWNQSLRMGWIQCVPLFPFFGGDDYRVKRSPGGDFRNAGNGDVVSYGFWSQPRNGDEVAVMFADGDPQKGFWVGCVPKFNRNFMVPGSPGRPPDDLDESPDPSDDENANPVIHKLTKQLKDEAPRDPPSLVPALEKARRVTNDPKNPVERELINVLVSPQFALNTQAAGLLCDVLRGAGNSSSRRESPSYVLGMKSAGWNFDSEKGNLNTASGSRTRFQDQVSTYGDINTTGHQLTFDDHPDFQGVRLRTSAGSQLYFHDTCDEPLIYISTAKGNVWIEMSDDGQIKVFGEDSLSVHARKDINFTADRDINLDAQRDLKIQVRRDTEFKFKGETHIEMGKNDLSPQGLNYEGGNWGTGAPQNTFIQNYGNIDWTVNQQFDLTVLGGWDVKITADASIQALASINLLAGASLNIGAASIGLKGTAGVVAESGTSIDLKAGTNMTQEAGNQFGVRAGGNYLETAVQIHMNGPPAPSAASTSSDPTAANTAAPPTIKRTVKKYISPTEEEIKQCRDPQNTFDTLDDMIIPQHQPWPGVCEKNIGFTGFVDVSPDEEARKGAARREATEPLTKVESGGVFQGVPYGGEATGEAPQYVKIRDLEPGEINSCTTYTISDRGIDFMRRHEGFRTKAYRDADGFSIGVGHFLKVGDQITGTLNGQGISRRLTAEDLRTIRRTEGDLIISESEVDRLFGEDLTRFENAVCNTVTTEVSQGQFDAMVAFAYNVGPTNLTRMVQSSNLNSGDFTQVPSTWMKYSRCPRCSDRGRVEAVLRRRRREELEQLFASA
jgi:lysozyme